MFVYSLLKIFYYKINIVVGTDNVYHILLYFLYNAQTIRVYVCIPIDSRKMVAYRTIFTFKVHRIDISLF